MFVCVVTSWVWRGCAATNTKLVTPLSPGPAWPSPAMLTVMALEQTPVLASRPALCRLQSMWTVDTPELGKLDQCFVMRARQLL